MTRPYLTSTIAEIEVLARDSPDPHVLKDIRSELQRRKSPRARRLLESLPYCGEATGPEGSEQEVRSNRSSTSKPARSETTPSDVSDGAAARYESLRATFTVEGELLARWGMTAAMPRDLQDLVLGIWEERLTGGPSDNERTPEKLDADRERLAVERHLVGVAGSLPWHKRRWPLNLTDQSGTE